MATSTLHYPAARRMLAGKAISGAGGWMQTTAASWYVLQETGQATAVGFLVAVALLPAVLLNPVGGALSDRYSPVTLQKWLALLAAIGPLLIATLFYFGDLSVPVLYVLVFLGAIPNALASPLMTQILPMSVPPELRANILANGAVTYNIARTVGPLIGGSVGIGWAFLLNGLSYLALAVILQLTPLRGAQDRVKAQKAKEPAPEHDEAYKKRVADAWSFPFVKALFLAAVMFYVASGAVHQLLAAVADLNVDTAHFLGVLYAAIAVGGIAANPFIKRFVNGGGNKTDLLYFSLIGAGPTIILLGISRDLWSDVLILFLLGGFGEAMWVGSQQSLTLDLPRRITGSILGIFFAAVTLATIGGALVVSWLFEIVGVRTGLVLLGVVAFGYGMFQIWWLRRAESEPNATEAVGDG
jgi:MFS family permease